MAKATTTDPTDQLRPRARIGALPRYLIAAVLIRLGDEGARVALVLLALERTDSAAVGGLLVAVLLVPQVVAAPAIGLLTDRARRPRWVLTTTIAGFATSLAAVAFLLGRVPLPVVVGILLLGGCCGPSVTGGLTSQLPTLVSESSLPRAFGADSLTYNVSGIAGPAIAAVIAGAAGATAATVALAGSAAAGALVLATLPIPRQQRSHDQPRLSLTAGFRALFAGRVLGTVTASSTFGMLGLGALPIVAAVLASRQHQPAATGWLMTAMAVGALIGSLIWTWRPVQPPKMPMTVMIALIGTGVPLALAAITASSLPVTAGWFGLAGISVGPFPLRGRSLYDSQALCARRCASSGLHHQCRTPAHHGSGWRGYRRGSCRFAQRDSVDLRSQRPLMRGRARRVGAPVYAAPQVRDELVALSALPQADR